MPKGRLLAKGDSVGEKLVLPLKRTVSYLLQRSTSNRTLAQQVRRVLYSLGVSQLLQLTRRRQLHKS